MDKATTIQGTSQEMLHFQLTLPSVWVVGFFQETQCNTTLQSSGFLGVENPLSTSVKILMITFPFNIFSSQTPRKLNALAKTL